MATVYLGLGSSIEDRVGRLREAVRLLNSSREDTHVEAISPIYESPHLGREPADSERYPQHLNCVVRVSTEQSTEELLRFVQEIEAAGERLRIERWGPRTIDIDILTYDDVQCDTRRLTLPHPGISERAFVVLPLSDIAPGLRFPNGQAVSELMGSPRIISQRIERIAGYELLL